MHEFIQILKRLCNVNQRKYLFRCLQFFFFKKKTSSYSLKKIMAGDRLVFENEVSTSTICICFFKFFFVYIDSPLPPSSTCIKYK